MPDAPEQRIVRNQKLDQPVRILGGRVPSLLLYQRPYLLSEAESLRLERGSKGLLSTVGAAILAFGLTYGMDDLVRYLQGHFLNPPAPPLWFELKVGGSAIFAGLVLIGVDLLLSLDRRRIMRKIAKHFQDNPATPEIRTRRT